jgi:molybdopterin converting factor small subunit
MEVTMAIIRIPAPLRPYTANNSSVIVTGDNVAAALADLSAQYPELRQHLFEGEKLRSFVNLYLDKQDVAQLQGLDTPLAEGDTLLIIPSIAGGVVNKRQVDQSALKVNQAFIIALLLLAFVLDATWLAAFVGAVMLLGTAVPSLSLFKRIYQHLLQPAGIVKLHVVVDNPKPHRFAQGFGGVVVALAVFFLLVGQPLLGWTLAWVVVGLAALNLFLGFCAGCFVYYQLNRWGVQGFTRSPSR